VMANLIADYDLTLGLAGYTSSREVDQASLVEVASVLPASGT